MFLTKTQIAARLKSKYRDAPINHHPYSEANATATPAAVLMPLISIKQAWYLLYIRRAEIENDSHSGEVAFPGGYHESHDINLETTALREAQEELGLIPDDVKILGRLRDHLSVTNFRISPFVGLIPWPYPLQIDDREVSRWFTMPLHWLATPSNRKILPHTLHPDRHPIPTIYFNAYEGETLWGATARITVELIETLSG